MLPTWPARYHGCAGARAARILYQTLREAYGVRLVRVEDLVETSLADPDEAALLSVDVGLPMLLIHRTAWDVEDRPVEFTPPFQGTALALHFPQHGR